MKPVSSKFLFSVAAAFLAGAALAGVALYATGRLTPQARQTADANDLAELKTHFRRPETVPFPASNPYSSEKAKLGEQLFFDTELSANGTIACATCHKPEHGFAEPKARSVGVPGNPLARHTPALWNLAWGRSYFWDGRARSLEEQAQGPIEARDEMAQPLDVLASRLAENQTYASEFAKIFPENPAVTADNITKALATYVRTLVSPPTRFDRWIAGEVTALTPQEVEGFRLFTGRAGCSNCHAGWDFSDQAFYDIGLPGEDRGRGAVLKLEQVDHAFKTPGLREIGRTAPYMHDGSLATLADVVRHYETGIVDRPTLPTDLRRNLKLSVDERTALVAFLGSLTSEAKVAAAADIVPTTIAVEEPARRVRTITQDDRTFFPGHVELRRGERLWILNNDSRTHNVRLDDPALTFDSGAQEPGETVEIEFPVEGSFLVFCGIHPKMELWVDIRP